jgi:RNA polymerase sigma factor (sigma-70 family)
MDPIVPRRCPLSPRAEFATTHWSVVMAAGDRANPAATEALERLCRTYWYPLYAYVRRRGYEAADAEDFTQEFFARLLAGDYLARANPEKGRFRAFLLSGIKYLLSDERDKARSLKRGGAAPRISFDQADAEQRYRLEPLDTLTPERAFEKTWVATLLDGAGRRLRGEYLAAGKGELYERLNGFCLQGSGQPSYAEEAARLHITESAVKSAIWRLRQRHQEIVREEVAQTLDDAEDMDDEIRYLLQVIGTD